MVKSKITLVNFIFNPRENWLPIGCISLIRALKLNEIDVDFRDFQLYKNDAVNSIDKFYSFFDNAEDIIAISCLSHALPFLIRVLEKIKTDMPDKTIILGGMGAVLVAKQLLQTYKFIDYIVLNNEHEVLPELVRSIIDKRAGIEPIDNIAYLNDGNMVFKGKEVPINNINQSILPELESFKNLDYYHAIPVTLAKGCIYRCTFCCIKTYNKLYYKRDSELAKEEISFYGKAFKNKKMIYLLDEGLLADKDRAYDFIEFAGQKKFINKLDFSCDARVNLMTQSLIKDLSRNNFVLSYYGIESGSNKIIRKINKNFTIEKAIETVELTKKYFSNVTVSFIYGYPYESFDEFAETLFHALYLSSKKIQVFLFLLCPLPGTSLYREFKDTLQFAPDLLPRFCGWKKQSKYLDPILSMAETYPDIFPTYYHYRSHDIGKKYRLAEQYKPKIVMKYAYDYKKNYSIFKKEYIR